jgi:hypothetical protein
MENLYVNEWNRHSNTSTTSQPAYFWPSSARAYRLYFKLDNCASVFCLGRNFSLSICLFLRKAHSVLPAEIIVNVISKVVWVYKATIQSNGDLAPACIGDRSCACERDVCQPLVGLGVVFSNSQDIKLPGQSFLLSDAW